MRWRGHNGLDQRELQLLHSDPFRISSYSYNNTTLLVNPSSPPPHTYFLARRRFHINFIAAGHIARNGCNSNCGICKCGKRGLGDVDVFVWFVGSLQEMLKFDRDHYDITLGTCDKSTSMRQPQKH